jgi:YD repeat-containing protein
VFNSYSYNDNNELISYSSASIYSSTLTYDDSGKIISELDNGDIQIKYTYDQKHQLILWSESIPGYSFDILQYKFFYNEAGQDTLKQTIRYNLSSGSYDITRFERLRYESTKSKNYSERKTYNASSTLLYTENFLWDNRPNPHLTNAFFTNEPPPSNNILQYTFTAAGGLPEVTNYIYTYNSNGFPLTQTIQGFVTIANYTYANCN